MHINWKTVFSNDYCILATHTRMEKYCDYSATDTILERISKKDTWLFEKNYERSSFDGLTSRREVYMNLTAYEREELMDELKNYSYLYGGEIYEGWFTEVPYIIKERKYKEYDIDICYSYDGIQYHKTILNFCPTNYNVDRISGFDIKFNVKNPEDVKEIKEHTITILELLNSIISMIKNRGVKKNSG